MSYGSNKEKGEYDYGKNMSIKYCQLSSDSYIPYWYHIRYWIEHEHRFSAQKCYSDISKFASRCFPIWIMNKEVRNGKRINRMKGHEQVNLYLKKETIDLCDVKATKFILCIWSLYFVFWKCYPNVCMELRHGRIHYSITSPSNVCYWQ